MPSLPSNNSCFSGNLFPLDTLFRSEDHISFLGAAWVFRRSLASVKGFEVGDTAVIVVGGYEWQRIGEAGYGFFEYRARLT